MTVFRLISLELQLKNTSEAKNMERFITRSRLGPWILLQLRSDFVNVCFIVDMEI